MKKFIINTGIIIILFIIIDCFCGRIFDRLYTNLPGRYSQTSTIYRSLFDEKAELLILGSSSASHHYNTRIFADSLNVVTYNAGMEGRDIIYSDIIFQSIFNRCKPEYVIVDICPGIIDGKWQNRVDCLRQYYGRNDVVTEYYDNETDWQQRLKLKSNLYRYNGTMSSLLSILLFDRESDTTAGYRPLCGEVGKMVYDTIHSFTPNSVCLRHLDNIVDMCKNNRINIVIVESPNATYNIEFDKWLKLYGYEKNVPVFMENEDVFWGNHPEYFWDLSHLNSSGADIFSKTICTKIMDFNNMKIR